MNYNDIKVVKFAGGYAVNHFGVIKARLDGLPFSKQGAKQYAKKLRRQFEMDLLYNRRYRYFRKVA